MDQALEILNEDHYGMQDVKDRVLEFIAVGKLHGKMQVCLCLSCIQTKRKPQRERDGENARVEQKMSREK